jgi:hypothetical protein
MTSEMFPTLYRVNEMEPREAAVLRKHAGAGEYRPVHPGVYVTHGEWTRLTPRRRHVVKALAAMPRLGTRLVASHETAAAVHRCPGLRGWPSRVHVTDPERVRAQATVHVVKHAQVLDPVDTWSVAGIPVTSPSRTAADLALSQQHAETVVVLDDLLRRDLVRVDDVEALIRARPRARSRVAALTALAFASPLAESPGESLARVVLARIGAPAPVLQHRFHSDGSFDPRVDFWFAEHGVVLEFDGAAPFTQSRHVGPRAPEQVAVDERLREDAIRAHPDVVDFVRCVWADLREPARLRAVLAEAGVPCRR